MTSWMQIISVITAAGMLVYLLAALLWPEKF